MKNPTVIIGRTLVATMFVVATPAWGQETPLTPAQVLFESGQKAVEDSRWSDAVRMFSEAYKFEPKPRTAAWLGRSQVEFGDYVAGAANLELYLQEEKDPPAKMKQKVLEMLGRAKEKIVTVRLALNPSDSNVIVDKLPLEPKYATWPIYLMPGRHSFEVQKPGFDTFKVEKIFKPSDAPTIEAVLQPVGVAGDQTHGIPPLAIAGFVVSGGLLVTAAITGVVANVASQNADDAWRGTSCKARPDCEAVFNKQYPRSTTFSAVALASLGVGVGAGVAALIYTLKVPKVSDAANAPKMSWIMLPTPRGIFVQGAW